MNNIVNIPDRMHAPRAQIESEAQEWVIALDGESATEHTLNEFRAWLRRSPLHRQAFRQAASVWGELDRWSEFLYPEHVAAPSSPGEHRGELHRIRRLRPMTAVTITGLVVALSAIIWVYSPTPGPGERFSAEYGVAVGEVKTIALPDGSNVSLNTGSRIAVTYDETGREVRLTEGEAYFEVAEDSQKPFVVYASKYAVRAVGTAFSVQMLIGRIEVNVTEGRVEVAGLKPQSRDSSTGDKETVQEELSRVPVVKGQQAILSEDSDALELVQNLEPAVISKELSWRDGMFIFDGDSLEDVVVEINRYTELKVVIADAAIRDLRFGGYFGIDDIPLILSTMEKDYGLRATRVNESLVYLSRQPGSPRTE